MTFFQYNNKRVATLLVATLLLFALPALAEVPKPVIPKGKGSQCVEPTDVMRARHFEFILHQRDETMHEGIRTPRHSLAQCLNCHVPEPAAGEARVRYGSDEHFCSSCHNYVGVTIDCFECHNDGPTGKALELSAGEVHPTPVAQPVDLVDEAMRLAAKEEEQ